MIAWKQPNGFIPQMDGVTHGVQVPAMFGTLPWRVFHPQAAWVREQDVRRPNPLWDKFSWFSFLATLIYHLHIPTPVIAHRFDEGRCEVSIW